MMIPSESIRITLILLKKNCRKSEIKNLSSKINSSWLKKTKTNSWKNSNRPTKGMLMLSRTMKISISVNSRSSRIIITGWRRSWTSTEETKPCFKRKLNNLGSKSMPMPDPRQNTDKNFSNSILCKLSMTPWQKNTKGSHKIIKSQSTTLTLTSRSCLI